MLPLSTFQCSTFQRSIMAVFALWTIWLAFVVHEHGSFPFNASKVGSPSESLPTQSMPPHWQTWSERSFRWWLSLFAELSLSHPGGSITFVPPIVLKTSVDPSDSCLYSTRSSAKLPLQKPPLQEKDDSALK
ncbi:hypothetical protein Y032_0228g2854 [Ancylostoma ceylanicum]|nr:hypothetical protein Y032_0228g2854 [Ancylostoma ceylanicum]